jgi:hypothetical protein
MTFHAYSCHPAQRLLATAQSLRKALGNVCGPAKTVSADKLSLRRSPTQAGGNRR